MGNKANKIEIFKIRSWGLKVGKLGHIVLKKIY